jgi:hypothetical protein
MADGATATVRRGAFRGGASLSRWLLSLVLVVVASVAGVVSVALPAGAATAVSNVSVSIASPSSAARALTTYVVGFKTSASGSLSGNAGATVTVVLPATTGVGSLFGPLMVGTTQVGSCQVNSGTTATCSLFGGATIAANTNVKVVLNGVTNPATAGGYKLTVSTTSDTTAVLSPTYTVTAVSTLTNLAVAIASPSSAAKALTTYVVTFTTSSTGGLAGDTGSTVTVVLPATTGVGSLFGPLMVGTTQVGSCQVNSGTTATCSLFGGATIAANTNVKVVLNGVTNPATTKAYSLGLSSSSDTTVQTDTYCIAATGVPCISGIAPTQGPIGQSVTITGINLTGATKVQFHGTAAPILTNTATQITTTVPAGATTGPITVVTGGGTATSATFTVTTPKLTLNQTSGPAGTHVTAYLTGFKANQSVTLHWDTQGGTVLATTTTNALGSSITTFVVPGAVNGNHSVYAIESGGPNTTAVFNVT